MIPALAFAFAFALAAPAPPDDSIYLLEAKFLDQHGSARRIDVHAGRPVLLAMFYATCPSACPRLIGDVKRVLAQVSERERAEVRVVLVSLDPARDTPPVLQGVIAARGLDPERTTLLTGSLEDTRRLAALLGVKYREDGKGAIDHSSRIVVLDGLGRIVGRKEGLGGSVSETAADLSRLLAARP